LQRKVVLTVHQSLFCASASQNIHVLWSQLQLINFTVLGDLYSLAITSFMAESHEPLVIGCVFFGSWLPIIALIIIKPMIPINIQVDNGVLLASLSFFFPSSVVKSHWQCLHFSAHFLIFSLQYGQIIKNKIKKIIANKKGQIICLRCLLQQVLTQCVKYTMGRQNNSPLLMYFNA
jgi:hypothetical protein